MSLGNPPINEKDHTSQVWERWFIDIKKTLSGLPIYANNAAAIAGNLKIGDFYRTGADPDPVMVVHA